MAIESKGALLPLYEWADYVQAVLLAALGGGVAAVSHPEYGKTPITWLRILAGAVCAGFTGVMSLYIVEYAGMTKSVAAFFIGVCGYAGPTVIITIVSAHPAIQAVFTDISSVAKKKD